jgi:hypothetical protein
MIDTVRIDDWLDRYRAAWATDDPDDVRPLFTEDVRYFTAPFDPPLEGHAQVLEYWLSEREAGIPWTIEYEVVAAEDALSVVRVVVTYPEGTRDAEGKREVFHNVWLVTLAADGRASEFVEYWMLAR